MPNYAFARSARLCSPSDFQRVFQHAQFKGSNKTVLILAVANDRNQPRLGLVIGKKNIRLAVQRNRVKRIVRESFRLRQHALPALDFVVLARRGLDGKHNTTINAELNALWENLSKRANKHR